MTHESPILFSAPMVCAILAGTKTQTRRIVKSRNSLVDGHRATKLIWGNLDLDKAVVDPGPSPADNPGPYLKAPMSTLYAGATGVTVHRVYPTWMPGDRLWVRETWAAPHACDHLPPRLIPHDARIHYAASEDRGGLLWRPSIHMPRHASRIALEVTGVRVERLQDISDAGARNEGAKYHDGQGVGHSGWRHDDGDVHVDARSAFGRLWKQINGPDSWDANPWVWVIEFKRVEIAS